MARKTDRNNIHEFTSQIHSTKRTGTNYSSLSNHNERKAKLERQLCCHDCRYFNNGGCSDYIGMYHKTCDEFAWW